MKDVEKTLDEILLNINILSKKVDKIERKLDMLNRPLANEMVGGNTSDIKAQIDKMRSETIKRVNKNISNNKNGQI